MAVFILNSIRCNNYYASFPLSFSKRRAQANSAIMNLINTPVFHIVIAGCLRRSPLPHYQSRGGTRSGMEGAGNNTQESLDRNSDYLRIMGTRFI